MPRAPIDTNMPPVLAPPRRFTAVGRASPFQKAGRSGKSPVPAFAVKIINKSPGMAAHDDEQQQQLPPPLHPSSWRLVDGPSKRRKGKGGGGKTSRVPNFQKRLGSKSPISSKLLPLALQRSSWGKKGRHPDGRVLFHNPRRLTCLSTSLLLGRCLQLHAVIQPTEDQTKPLITKETACSPKSQPETDDFDI